MCGITGFLNFSAVPADPELIRRMTATLFHRGPDDEGYHVDGPVALGHRRLSIVDLATGQQPIANEAGTVWAVLNGEIYNYRELRSLLRERGHRFRTNADTEVIVHAYEEFGQDCIAKLDGMFAIAIWDANAQLLLLARDRMGEKPLYYGEKDGVLVFGSELRALLAHPAVSREMDLSSLLRYLTSGYVPDPHAILKGIRKLPPGHLLAVSGGKSRLSSYWDITFARHPARSEAEWSAALWDSLCSAVRSRLMADVPVGVFLSGGLDSSAVVAAMAEVAPARRFPTFSISFEESSYNEEPYARLVAERFGAEHRALAFTSADAKALIPQIGGLQAEPLADPAILPTLHLARHVRDTAAVVLDGDGGDELFCGYPTFFAVDPARWFRRLPASAQRLVARAINALPASRRYNGTQFALRQFLRACHHPMEIQTQILMGGFTRPDQQELLSAPLRHLAASFDPYEDIAAVMKGAPVDDTTNRLVYHHAKLFMAGQTLVKMDRATMASGLEARAPFLDHRLVELACAIPGKLKLRRWKTKYILKRALDGRLPASVVHRRKQGFGVPLAQWIRGPLKSCVEEFLDADRLRHIGLFSPEGVQRLMAEHMQGRYNHAKALWTLVAFEFWREAYLPGQRWS